MTTNEELLQRCFDNDLTDKEMKMLFTALSSSASLRGEFKDLQTLRSELNVLRHPSVPASLDRKVESITASAFSGWSLNRPAFRRVLSRRIPVPAYALLTAAVILIIGSMAFYGQQMLRPSVTHYVYVYEMQPFVVQSHFVQ
jgi:hypothetical protein